MAQVTSLGVHTPTALSYCIAEHLLPDPPPPNSYQWTLSPSIPDEELLVVGDTVIWSQGGIVQRVYRFTAEKEAVQQALFAWFSDEDDFKSSKKKEEKEAKRKDADQVKRKKSNWNSKSRTYATQLGSFPKIRKKQPKDVAFMDIDEDEVEEEHAEPDDSRRRALVVFLKNQAFIYFLSGTSYVVHLPCEIQYALAAPLGLLLQGKLSSTSTALDTTRLFTLKDPLADLGMVLNHEDGAAMNALEEILFIEQVELAPFGAQNVSSSEVILAVTRNLQHGWISIWQAKYIPQAPIGTGRRVSASASGTMSRRRSSFGPGTGAATPVAPNPSMISPEQSIRLDFDKEANSNRRVSSLVARADLAGSMDRTAFNDMAKAGSSSFQGGPMIDQLLDELNSNQNLEALGVTDMGTLKNELMFTKIESIPCHFGIENQTLESLPRIFIVPAPKASTAAETEGQRIVLVIVNHASSQLLQIVLQLPAILPEYMPKKKSLRRVTLVDVLQRKAKDAIQLSDGNTKRLLTLTEDGQLQVGAPWCPSLTLPFPNTLARSNMHQAGQKQKKKRDFARSLSMSLRFIKGFRYPEESGRVSIIDENDTLHRLQIQISPKDVYVRQALNVVRYVLPPPRGGETISVAWMEIMRSKSSMKNFALPAVNTILDEWKGFVITIMMLGVSALPANPRTMKRRSGFSRISSSSSASWEDLLKDDDEIGPQAEYLRSNAWEWIKEAEEEREEAARPPAVNIFGISSRVQKNGFFSECIASAREFLGTAQGKAVEPELFTRSSEPEVRRTSFAMLTVGLHLLREEWKLDISMEQDVRRMSGLLLQMSLWMGWMGWVDGYLAEDIEVEGWEFDDSRFQGTDVPEPQFKQPCIYDWLVECFHSREIQIPYMTLHDIVVPKSNSLLNTSAQCVTLTPKTRYVTELFSLLRNSDRRFESVVALMVKMEISLSFIEKLPEGIALPLFEAIARVQDSPPTSWGESALELLSRKDLKMLLNNKFRREGSKWISPPMHDAVREVHQICSTTLEPESLGAFDGSSEIDRSNISRLIFNEDRRMQEALRLLSSGRPVAVKFIPEPEWDENAILDNQAKRAQQVALRTLAVPSGRGLVYYSARIPLLTEKFPTPGFNLTVVMKPSNTTISPDKQHYSEEKVCWAFFHTGVAAGLSISREAIEIDTSWIVYNKPSDLSNRHAGFLLALGLNGHLKSIAKWDAFNYLTPKHTMTCIGLLLGLAASYLGTMDPMITKLLSVHVVRLLPAGSADLNLSPLTQTAGLMGVGLLYYNTCHRRMTETLLSEIEHVEAIDPSAGTDNLRDEGYRLAAGFALGFINLAKGASLKSLQDLRIVERLLDLAVGSKNIEMVHALDKATAGATIALTLIYMKSNNEALAKKIEIPDTVALMDYVRPDLFLLRTLAKHLILWDKIEPTLDWISKNFPLCLKTNWKLEKIKALDSSHLPLFNVVGGFCFAIGLRYAGTMDLTARDTLLYYLDQFTKLCLLGATNYDQKLSRATARNCQDVIALSAATVMAGSGDLEVFRRLRRMHGKVDGDMPFGSHLACHIAIGALFLAGGNFTFSTSSLAIASLLLAFYPLYPNSILDNRSHLQAFRHFWVLAAEPRCLIPRDVETNRPISIPVAISMKDGRTITSNAPCMLPELDLISSIKTRKAQFWPSVLDFENNPEHLAAFLRSQTIYVQDRPVLFSTKSVYRATFAAVEEEENAGLTSGFEWIWGLKTFTGLETEEKTVVLPADVGSPVGANMRDSIIDGKVMMERSCLGSGNADRLRNVKLVFAFVDWVDKGAGDGGENGGLVCLGRGSVERLRAAVWTAFS